MANKWLRKYSWKSWVVIITALFIISSHLSWAQSVSAQKPLQPQKFQTFTEWCLNKAYLSRQARETVNQLLAIAETSNCQAANQKLSQLSKLELVYVGEVPVTLDLSPLSTLDNITYLYLDISAKILDFTENPNLGIELKTDLLDLRPIASLTNLEKLTILSEFFDLNPLKPLTKLTSLHLQFQFPGSSREVNLSSLESLTNLRNLLLSNGKTKNLDPLKSLTNLEELYLVEFQTPHDFQPLKSLNHLKSLALHGTQINAINFLPSMHLSELKVLDLSKNSISNLAPLKSFKQLQELNLSRNQITDLSPLKSLTDLKILDLSDNQIQDLSPLKDLSRLNKLKLQYNQIQDLSPLKSLTQLSKLRLSVNKISELQPLAFLKELETLYLAGNRISNLAPLDSLKKLRILNLIANPITNLDPLKRLTNLQIVYLKHNRLKEKTCPLAPKVCNFDYEYQEERDYQW